LIFLGDLPKKSPLTKLKEVFFKIFELEFAFELKHHHGVVSPDDALTCDSTIYGDGCA